MDKVILNRIELLGSIGVLETEKRSQQRYWITIEIGADLKAAGTSDRLEDTIDYAQVYSIAAKLMTSGDCQLIETYAERLADRIFDAFSKAEWISIEALKPDAPIEGTFESVGIRIERNRDD